MEAVKVKKSELLEVLKKNRELHHKIFLEAQGGYRSAVISELDSMLEDARNGKRIRRQITLVEPVNQTADYDRVIRMMEMSCDETINLAEQEFEAYVLDNWRWKQQFNASNRGYSKTLMAFDGGNLGA